MFIDFSAPYLRTWGLSIFSHVESNCAVVVVVNLANLLRIPNLPDTSQGCGNFYFFRYRLEKSTLQRSDARTVFDGPTNFLKAGKK